MLRQCPRWRPRLRLRENEIFRCTDTIGTFKGCQTGACKFQEVALKTFAFKNSLRNFPCGSNFLLRAINSGSFSYAARNCAGGIVNSFPQCGRGLKGANSL